MNTNPTPSIYHQYVQILFFSIHLYPLSTLSPLFPFPYCFAKQWNVIILQNYSHVSISLYFVINVCYNIYFVDILLYGYFCKALFKKSFIIWEPDYIENFYVIIFDIYDFFVILNGF